MRQVALLRGINLASHRRIGMADLREALTGQGHEDVRTHLQSGNVVLSSELAPGELADVLAREIEARFGFAVPVVVRTRDELAAVVERDPFGDAATEPRRYQVTFLSGEPDPAAVRRAEAAATGGERLVVAGREAYAWHPEGLQRSALARALTDERLGVTATARNWTTVGKLLALAADG